MREDWPPFVQVPHHEWAELKNPGLKLVTDNFILSELDAKDAELGGFGWAFRAEKFRDFIADHGHCLLFPTLRITEERRAFRPDGPEETVIRVRAWSIPRQ